MNERMIELANEAGYKDLPTVRLAFQDFDKEKFAELIVRECEQVVAVQLESEREPNDEWDRGYVSGMWAATRYMKEQFGVEE